MHVHILGAYVHICARYEVSVINLLVGGLSTDDTNDDNDDANDDNDATRWTIHDCIGSSAISK